MSRGKAPACARNWNGIGSLRLQHTSRRHERLIHTFRTLIWAERGKSAATLFFGGICSKRLGSSPTRSGLRQEGTQKLGVQAHNIKSEGTREVWGPQRASKENRRENLHKKGTLPRDTRRHTTNHAMHISQQHTTAHTQTRRPTLAPKLPQPQVSQESARLAR